MIDTATGRRTPSGVITGGDAGLVARLEVDVVVADAEAGDHGEAAVLRHARAAEAGDEQDERVEALQRRGRHGAALGWT
jgi:hypothetical protein